jgi:hypothetical protein
MPMLVSSAASPIGRKPAISADATPRIQVIRVGAWCFGSVVDSQAGSS